MADSPGPQSVHDAPKPAGLFSKAMKALRANPLFSLPRAAVGEIDYQRPHGRSLILVVAYVTLAILVLGACVNAFLRPYLPVVTWVGGVGEGTVLASALLGFVLAWVVGWSLVLIGALASSRWILVIVDIAFAWFTTALSEGIGIWGLLPLVILPATFLRGRLPILTHPRVTFFLIAAILSASFIPLLRLEAHRDYVMPVISAAPLYFLVLGLPFWVVLSFSTARNFVKWTGMAFGKLRTRAPSRLAAGVLWILLVTIGAQEMLVIYLGDWSGGGLLLIPAIVVMELIRRAFASLARRFPPILSQWGTWSIAITEVVILSMLLAWSVIVVPMETFSSLYVLILPITVLWFVGKVAVSAITRQLDTRLLYQTAHVVAVVYLVQLALVFGITDPSGSLRNPVPWKLSLFFVLTIANIVVASHVVSRGTNRLFPRSGRTPLLFGVTVLVLGALVFNVFAVDYSSATFNLGGLAFTVWVLVMVLGVSPFMIWQFIRHPARLGGRQDEETESVHSTPLRDRLIGMKRMRWRQIIVLSLVAVSSVATFGYFWHRNYQPPEIVKLVVMAMVKVGQLPTGAVVTEGSLWVANFGDDAVSRIDLISNRLMVTIPVGHSPTDIVVDGASLWVINSGDGTVSRVDISTQKVEETVAVGAGPFRGTISGGTLWICRPEDNSITGLDTRQAKVTRSVTVGRMPSDIAATGAFVWVTNWADNTVTRIDSSSGKIRDTVPAGFHPQSVALYGADGWVGAIASQTEGSVHFLSPSIGNLRSDNSLIVRAIIVDGLVNARDVVAGQNGLIWISASPRGLYVIDSKDKRLLASGEITGGILALGEGTAWVVNREAGVAYKIGGR